MHLITAMKEIISLSFYHSTYFSLPSTTKRVSTVNMVQLRRVCNPTMIGEWIVSTIDSRSTQSAQLYHACARLACAASSCYYRLGVQTLKAEKELWDLINKQSTNQSICRNRIPYSTQLLHDFTDPKRYSNQEL